MDICEPVFIEELSEKLTSLLEDKLNLEIADAIEYKLDEILEDKLEDVIADTIENNLTEALNNALSNFEFVLPNGVVVRPKQRIKILSPDKNKLLPCEGGLRVDGSCLIVQTRETCWETLACYQTKEEATEALIKIKDAMAANLPLLEL